MEYRTSFDRSEPSTAFLYLSSSFYDEIELQKGVSALAGFRVRVVFKRNYYLFAHFLGIIVKFFQDCTGILVCSVEASLASRKALRRL